MHEGHSVDGSTNMPKILGLCLNSFMFVDIWHFILPFPLDSPLQGVTPFLR